MPLPLSGSDIVSQIKSSAIAAADFGLRNNGPKPNNITSAVQYNSSKPTGFKRQYILSLQQKLNNLVFNVDSPSTYFNTINQLLANQPVPTIVTTTLTQGLYNYFYYAGIDDLQVGTPILNLATTNQNGVQVFDIAQIDQIDPGSKHYIYFSDDKPIQIGNTKIEIIQPSNASKKLKVTLQNGNSTQYEFKDEITIDGETFQFLGSGSGGLFIYKGRNYAIVNTTNTITTEINDPKNNNIDGIALDSDENIYLADYGNNRVLKYNSSTGILIKIYESQLFDNPRGIVLDSANNIYVTNYNANTLVKISATNGDITKVLDNIEKPYGICYNDSTYQRFYITCDGSVKVAGPDPNTGIFGILNSFDSFSDSILKGITIDSLGANIYVVLNTNQVVKILTSNGNATPYYTFTADITNKPNGITIDSSNNLYLVVSGKNKIVRITSQNVADDFVNNNNLKNPQGIVFNSLSNNFYVTNKLGIDPVLKINNTYSPLVNNGFPNNGKILWICKNNKYTENVEFYVLVNVTDSSQNLDSIYKCSITSRDAVYTKICDYTYGQYDIVLEKSEVGNDNIIVHTENFEPDDIYGNFSKSMVEVCGEYIGGGYVIVEFRCRDTGYQKARLKYTTNGIKTSTEWRSNDTSDTYEKKNALGLLDQRYNRPMVSNISLPQRPIPPTTIKEPQTSYTLRNRSTPRCMTSDQYGNIYITNYGNSSNKDLPAIYKYHINKNLFSTLIVGSTNDAFHGIEYFQDYIYYSNPLQNKVFRLDTIKKKFLFDLEVSGKPTLLSLNNSSGDVFVYRESQTKISQIRVGGNIYLSDNYLIRSDNINAFVKTSNDNSTYFADTNKLYKFTPNSGSNNDIKGLNSDIVFRKITNCLLDSSNRLYVVDDNKNIYSLNDKPLLSSNIKLPRNNIKQGFVPSGNRFYVGDSNSNSIIKNAINSNINYNIVIGGNGIFDNPKAIVKDSNGNIFVLSTGDKSIYKVVTDNQTITYATNLPSPNGGMAIDTNGNIYITNLDNTISKINSSGLVETFISSQATGFVFLKNPIDLIIDSNNENMYILNEFGGTIAKVVMSTKVVSEFVGNLPLQFSGLAIDSSNNLYFLNQTDNALAKVYNSGALTNKFIGGIIDATDIYHENNKLYVLTSERQYYLIDVSQRYAMAILLTINTENYVASIPITTSTSITQPVKIPDGTEYVNFVLIGGGGSGGYEDNNGGGSGAQLKFRIKVNPSLNYFKFEVGKGGGPSQNGGNTKVNFFSDKEATQYSIVNIKDGNNYSPLPLKDVFIAGGGDSGVNGGLGGRFPKLHPGYKFPLNPSGTSSIDMIVEINSGLLDKTIQESATQDDHINVRGSLYGIDGLISDPLFNVFGLGGDLNSNIYTSYNSNNLFTSVTEAINNGTPTNTLNGNFKKISTISSSKNFDLSLYSPGKGGRSTRGDVPTMSGNDGLVAWFFEGPSQYTEDTLDSLFKVPKSLMNQKFDNKWFTFLSKADSAIISAEDLNNSNNKTARFLCDTDGNITLVDGGSGYTVNGDIKILRSENSIFKPTDDLVVIVNSVGPNGTILTWSFPPLQSAPENRPYNTYNITIPEDVTQVDCAMIGAGGSSGPYIREPIFVPTTEITFSIEVKYRNYSIISHGPVAWAYNVPPAGETTNDESMSFYNITIWNRTYTLTELCNEINGQLDEQRRFTNVGNVRFTILTKENYMGSTTDPTAYYGFITDQMPIQDFTTGEWDFAGSNKYTKQTIQTYTIKLTNITSDSFLFRTSMNNTFGRECVITDSLPGGTRVSSIYFPSLLRQVSNTTIPDNSQFFGVNNANKHPTHILPSFDGGDGSPGQYQRRIINVESGDTLEIKIGRADMGTGPYIVRSPQTNNSFVVLTNPSNDLLNGFNGNNTEIIHKRNSIIQNTITSLGGKGGLSSDPNRLNDQTIIDKPGLPSGSFTYPITVPPEWQDGYGKGGTTNRNLSYDNPGVRGSHGCAMIKFS